MRVCLGGQGVKLRLKSNQLKSGGGVDPLISRAIEGDEDAFTEFYKTYFNRVQKACLSVVKNPDIADDLAQKVFMKLSENSFKRLKSFKGDSALTTWLHRIAINEALMYLRKKIVRKEITTGQEEVNNLIIDNATHSMSHSHEENEILNKVARERAIEKLPTGYKRVYLLRYVQGYEEEEVSKMLGISVGTVKSQLHKARHKLRGLLN